MRIENGFAARIGVRAIVSYLYCCVFALWSLCKGLEIRGVVLFLLLDSGVKQGAIARLNPCWRVVQAHRVPAVAISDLRGGAIVRRLLG